MKKSEDEFLNDSLLLLAVHPASLPPDLSYSLRLFPPETTQCAVTFAKLQKALGSLLAVSWVKSLRHLSIV